MSYKDGGYYQKFEVLKDGDPVNARTFTLMPDCDPHAKKAVLAYADSVQHENPQLTQDLVEAFGE